ncbi:MAG: nitrate/nitrite transporter, partial [Candidatus Binatia bacterium]
MPVLFLASIFFINFSSRIILSPLLPTIEKDLGISHSQAGLFFLLISAGYFAALLGSGFLSSCITHRGTIILSSAAVGTALLGISFINSLWGIRLGLLSLGLASGLYLPSAIATITSLVGSRDWGKAIAIHEVAPNLAFVTAPLVSEVFLRWFSWRMVLALLGGISVILSLAFGRFGKGGEFPGEKPASGSFRIFFREPSFWIIVSLFGLGISSTIGIFAMLPLYLVTEREMDQNWANTLVAFSRVSGLGTTFVAGWASDLLGPKRTMAGILLLTGITTMLLGIMPGSWVVVAVFLQPALAGCFFPAGFAA